LELKVEGSKISPRVETSVRLVCERDGTWGTLPASGAVVCVEGKSYIVDLESEQPTRASLLWRLLERKKEVMQQE
jgi:hypothetical protein